MMETSRIELQRFPDFGKELRRPFEVHEVCYDCAEFYGPGHGKRGCDAWPANRPIKTPDGKHLLCQDFNRLPDVMPGEPAGQVFPPSRMDARKTPRGIQTETGQPKPETSATMRPRRIRLCDCGAELERGKRLCDRCRGRRRKQSKRAYMRSYMSQRRSEVDRPDSDMPFPAILGHHTHGSGDDLCPGRPSAGGERLQGTSVLTGTQ